MLTNMGDKQTTSLIELRAYLVSRGWVEDEELSRAGYPDVFVHEGLQGSLDLSCETVEAQISRIAFATRLPPSEVLADIMVYRRGSLC